MIQLLRMENSVICENDIKITFFNPFSINELRSELKSEAQGTSEGR
jgi:hypothetical protein